MTTTTSDLAIDLRQMVIAIETAVSLVGMNDTNHGKRVGFIACQIGQQLGFGKQDAQFAFDLGMLHDCGVSTEQTHANLAKMFDWTDAHIHCEIGYHLLKDFAPLTGFAVPILHHHTRWEQLKDLDISAFDKQMANLIFLSDRVDMRAVAHYGDDILLARKDVAASIYEHAGTYFDPAIVEAFREVERHEAFWISLEARHITRYVWDMEKFRADVPLSLDQLRHLSLIMAYIVDQKSPFTAQHSARVADLARFLAALYGLPPAQCDKVEIAGLLHDLGKLNTPDAILEKAGPLNDVERSIMNQHSYETYEILRHIEGLHDVAQWAAYHHEWVNGAGYPFHPSERDLSIEARIIAVADIFQALEQDRPYRDGKPLEQVLAILDEMTLNGKLDGEIVALARKHAERCFAVAKGTDPEHNRRSLEVIVPGRQ